MRRDIEVSNFGGKISKKMKRIQCPAHHKQSVQGTRVGEGFFYEASRRDAGQVVLRNSERFICGDCLLIAEGFGRSLSVHFEGVRSFLKSATSSAE